MKSKSYLCFFVVLAILLLSSGHALAAKINWAGEWLRIGSKKYYNARITIKNVTKNDFKFEIFVLAGGNHGIIEGSATIKKNQAFFPGENNCKLSFRIKEDSLIVDATEGCTSYAGIGAYFDGTYQK